MTGKISHIKRVRKEDLYDFKGGKSTVSRWETGETPVNEKTKWKLSLLYQVDLEQLEFKNRKEK